MALYNAYMLKQGLHINVKYSGKTKLYQKSVKLCTVKAYEKNRLKINKAAL